MILAMFACLISRKTSDEKLVELLKDREEIYRDKLTEKISPLPSQAVKKSVRFADSEHAILREKDDKDLVKSTESGEIKGGIRVKVKMTKEEAARLLSKCKEGGILEFKDVARELVDIPLNRVTVFST
ncbi:uncharacterized protein LOC130735894 [Lotus japonicus]|uniref:DUF7890 domain-containing protein n=1 Tax=Lotus japonicus TaxID=34305 RepID=I3SH06_LOTJA|nr:uncharacterized protein LOC130735894 [Lotus japonicus]AFK39548.1 unknown [Lotus japonicus]